MLVMERNAFSGTRAFRIRDIEWMSQSVIEMNARFKQREKEWDFGTLVQAREIYELLRCSCYLYKLRFA